MTPATVATLVITVVVVCVVALTLAMPLRTYFSQRSEFRQLTASNEQLRREVADYQQKVNEQNDPPTSRPRRGRVCNSSNQERFRS